ncbi:MAG TPA: DUF58 domain-containing protein [Acidimicrobiales bacterium]|nr:DUF58 domain-containing protein [Acidimicrobiales bacterium]
MPARPTLTLAQRRRLAREAEARQSPVRRALEAVTSRTGITSSGLILVAIAIVAWLVGYWIGGRPLYLVAYGALAVLGLAWGIGRRPLPLTGTRADLRPRVAEGAEVSIEVALTASRSLSNVVLEEQVPAMLGEPARLPIATVDGGETVGHTYSLVAWRRGSYTIGPLVARWGDPFGLTDRTAVLAEPFELLVHPAVEPVEDHPLTRLWEDPPFRPPVSRPWPHGMEFYGMRQYQKGDDIRRMVWRAFARTGELLVRESEQGITDKLVIIFDQDRENHSKGIVSDSFEAACRVVASLGVRHLRDGYSVTVEGTSDKIVGPLRGGPSSIQLLDELARIEPVKGSLREMFDRLLLSMRRDTHVVVVTPLLDSAAASRLRLLVDRGQSVVVVALMWLDEAVDTLASAAGLGVHVVEVGPNTNLTLAFRREVAAVSR